MLPLISPWLAMVAILTAVEAWNECTMLATLTAFLFTQRFFMRGMDGAVK